MKLNTHPTLRKWGEGVPIHFSMLYSSSSTGGRGYTDDIEKVHIPPRPYSGPDVRTWDIKTGLFLHFPSNDNVFLLRAYLVGKSGPDNSIFAPIPSVKKSLSEYGCSDM